MVGAAAILDLSGQGNGAGDARSFLILKSLEDVDGGVADMSDLHLLNAGLTLCVCHI